MHQVVLSWFKENKRDLPWRKTTPWGVMMSEFMLQQTPVNRVLPVWTEWMERWPTPAALAAAKRSEVLTAWGRLGYPRRALRLHESAAAIVERHGGEVPNDQVALRALPGVGEYTAAAIGAFAFGQSTLVLDINIRRLFSRYFDGIEFPSAAPSRYERELRLALIPEVDGAAWAAATMEFGALICTSRSPKCDECPLRESCAWKLAGSPRSEIVRKGQAWEGTDRQCRGTVIQALRDSSKISRSELSTLWPDQLQLDKALRTLLADGLIEATGKSFKLPD